MKILPRLLLVTFIECIANTILLRGIYLIGKYDLHFEDTDNLWLTLIFGLANVPACMLADKITAKIPERKLMLFALLAQVPIQLALLWAKPFWAVAALNVTIGIMCGLKWPVMQSYVSAGRTPQKTRQALGIFNLSWASGVPIGATIAGTVATIYAPYTFKGSIFIFSAGLNIIAALLFWNTPNRPNRLEESHPERPDLAETQRLTHLLSAHRMIMFASYATMIVISALLPGVLKNMEIAERENSAISSVFDWCRLAVFIFLGAYAGWHGKRWPIFVSIIFMPVGFFLTLFAPNVGLVMLGELIFGITLGLSYFGALYYAQVVKNAAVDAGGKHEAFIGSGYAIGPALAILAINYSNHLNGLLNSMLIMILPIFAISSILAAISAFKSTRKLSS